MTTKFSDLTWGCERVGFGRWRYWINVNRFPGDKPLEKTMWFRWRAESRLRRRLRMWAGYFSDKER